MLFVSSALSSFYIFNLKRVFIVDIFVNLVMKYFNVKARVSLYTFLFFTAVLDRLQKEDQTMAFRTAQAKVISNQFCVLLKAIWVMISTSLILVSRFWVISASQALK